MSCIIACSIQFIWVYCHGNFTWIWLPTVFLLPVCCCGKILSFFIYAKVWCLSFSFEHENIRRFVLSFLNCLLYSLFCLHCIDLGGVLSLYFISFCSMPSSSDYSLFVLHEFGLEFIMNSHFFSLGTFEKAVEGLISFSESYAIKCHEDWRTGRKGLDISFILYFSIFIFNGHKPLSSYFCNFILYV